MKNFKKKRFFEGRGFGDYGKLTLLEPAAELLGGATLAGSGVPGKGRGYPLPGMPDIDIDFPREIREQLIKRIHQKWGPEHAVLTGMIVTYKMKSAIRDVAQAFGISSNKISGDSRSIANAKKTDADVFNIAKQICGYPKYLAQHPGGMILSSSPITNYVPIIRLQI